MWKYNNKYIDACEVFGARKPLVIWDVNTSAIAAGWSHGVPAEHLEKIWHIPFDDAARTLHVTT